jgi:hypothetical protein
MCFCVFFCLPQTSKRNKFRFYKKMPRADKCRGLGPSHAWLSGGEGTDERYARADDATTSDGAKWADPRPREEWSRLYTRNLRNHRTTAQRRLVK